jgi:hypothetical protein
MEIAKEKEKDSASLKKKKHMRASLRFASC